MTCIKVLVSVRYMRRVVTRTLAVFRKPLVLYEFRKELPAEKSRTKPSTEEGRGVKSVLLRYRGAERKG